MAVKKHAVHFSAILVCTQLMAAGCVNLPPTAKAIPPPVADSRTSQLIEKPASPAPPPQQPPPQQAAQQPPQQPPRQVVTTTDSPTAASVPNPVYHPGVTEELHFSGLYEGEKTITVTGKITLIVTKELAHGKSVNVLNSVIDLLFPDGKRHIVQQKSVFATEHDGSLKLLYKESGPDVRWVESNTCARTPSDFVDGHTAGCEVHYDDGSIDKSTSSVTKDGDFLKVTWITASTDAKGEHDDTESYWYDVSNRHLVRYYAEVTLADGSQMTIKGH
jgi:hypothetical protein